MNETTTLGQYLTFTLGDEIYALDVRNVREVLEMVPITPIPRASEHMRGVINVRGSVVPVLDLRLRFGLTKTEQTIDTCVVVIEGTTERGQVVMGALVDSVREVVDLDSTQIEPPPHIGTGTRTGLILGIGKKEDKFLLILDIEKLISKEDTAAAQMSPGTATAQMSPGTATALEAETAGARTA
jgi:purine-binding chemotaxis protein CheW